MPCLPVLILALHKVPVWACIAQHLLAELTGNRAICQWEEEELVSNTDVVCATRLVSYNRGLKDTFLGFSNNKIGEDKQHFLGKEENENKSPIFIFIFLFDQENVNARL